MTNNERPPLFLYVLKLTPQYEDPAAWTDEAGAIISAHAQFLDELGKEGKLLLAGRTQYAIGHSDLFGIAIVVAETLEAAQEMMAPDPAVLNGIQQATLHPYSIAIRHFDAFEG